MRDLHGWYGESHVLHGVSFAAARGEVVALLGLDAASRGVEVALDLAARPSVVMGDRVHLQQVLLNLILNAVDASMAVPAERRRVLIYTRSMAGQVEVSVEDTGSGIAGDPASIFEPFFTTKPDGMGMGLSIARSIVEAHGGTIRGETRPQGGARFTIELPRGTPPSLEGLERLDDIEEDRDDTHG